MTRAWPSECHKHAMYELGHLCTQMPSDPYKWTTRSFTVIILIRNYYPFLSQYLCIVTHFCDFVNKILHKSFLILFKHLIYYLVCVVIWILYKVVVKVDCGWFFTLSGFGGSELFLCLCRRLVKSLYLSMECAEKYNF